jgi:hypothetical protein
MAAQILFLLESGKRVYRNSNTLTIDTLSIKVGASGLEIKESSSQFDFSAVNITNAGTFNGRSVATDGANLDGHLDNTGTKHTAARIAYALSDGSKKDIQAASDDVETALKDLDDLKISKTGSIPFSGNIDLGGFLATNAADPVSAQDLVTKSYVDGVRVFSRIIGNAAVATTANITLSGTQTVDGYALSVGELVLVKNQSTATQNGVYQVAAGAWARASQLNNAPAGEIYNGVFVPKIINGATQAGQAFVISSQGTGLDGLHIIGTDVITWSLFTPASSLSSGDGINATSFLSNIIAVQVSQLVGDGIEDDGSNNFRVKLNGPSLARSASGLSISALGVGTAELAANAVTKAKLNSDVVGGDISSGLKLDGTNQLARQDSTTRTNDNGSAITLRQFVYIKSNGNVDLAIANSQAIADAPVGIVETASIASGGSGLIYSRPGTVVGGYAGLTPGPVYMHPTVAGSFTQTLPVTTSQFQRQVGIAISATQIVLEPSDFSVQVLF